MTACATGTSAPSRPVPHNIRALHIVPKMSKACPSEVISASYEVVGDSGTRVTLGRRDLSLLKRSGIAADPREDGAWQTATDPVASLYDGFHLTAVLASDTTVRADTVVVPTYRCLVTAVRMTTEADALPKAGYVRLGTLRTPFYDSVVVASIELEGRPPRAVVFGPTEMRNGAIAISAAGRDGAQGRGGVQGSDGGPCENGSRGGNGDAGYPGAPGGQVDIILEAGAPWLANLVSIDNRGGRGGPGGPGGAGGSAGPVQIVGGRSCSTSPGSRGSPGLNGPDGSPGPLPKTTTIPRSLLWYGSPLWNDITARRVLGQLVEYTTRP